MVYSTNQFLLVFLPIVLLGYFALSKLKNFNFQKVFLILASLFFYGYNNWIYLLLILLSILINYVVAHFMQKSQSKLLLILGILFNVGLLGYFKYYDFFVSNVNAIFRTSFVLKNIILPLGISFFTFQQLSFLISVYKKEEQIHHFFDYCLFVVFFPQLVAGPIVLYSEMIPQFKDDSRRYFNIDNFCKGLFLFGIGMFKKTVIADTIALFVDNGFAMTDIGFSAAWITSLSYTFQIYFDFSGYSDMAIGLGKMFNIDITENFNSPYQSKSISEFWRRWHITLGRALRSYVYFPLGGNRKGLTRTCFNLLITFLVSGIWHGANWTFILWGLLHGVFMVIERLLRDQLEKIPAMIRTAGTFLITNALWVLFRAESFSQVLTIYKGMLNVGNIHYSQLQQIANDALVNFPAIIDIVYVLVIVGALLAVTFLCKNSTSLYKNFAITKKTAWITAMCMILSLIFMSRGSVFIYFNF